MTCAVFLMAITIGVVGFGLILGFSLLLSLFLPQLIALIGGFILGIFAFTFVMVFIAQKYEESGE